MKNMEDLLLIKRKISKRQDRLKTLKIFKNILLQKVGKKRRCSDQDLS